MTGEPMAALVESDKPPVGEISRDPLPVAGIRAQAVKQDQRGMALGGGYRRPLEVMEPDSIAFEPSFRRCAH